MKRVLVRRNAYYDSVFLMQISQEAKKLAGITDAVVAMGTEMNRDLLADLGFASAELSAAKPTDLVIALEAAGAGALDRAVVAAERLLRRRGGGVEQGGAPRPASLEAALKEMPEANVAIISLPGDYAAREAGRALRRGLHVMLFSDNVSLEDEIRLKEMARERGLLMMGPDCGTAIINGKPLCFANVVRRGDIGVVAASGTGLQEVTCLIDRLGGGVSQAIGTGGRDLKDERVGGSTMLAGIVALARDAATRVIAILSKPPAPAVADRVIAALADSGKPAVVHFIGHARAADRGRLRFAGSLEETAGLAVALAAGRSSAATLPGARAKEIEVAAEREAAAMGRSQRHLRGLFTGGTLADEALIVLDEPLGGVFSNNQINPKLLLADPHRSRGHTIVDLGDDVFTVGRPHPMIDPSIRVERLAREAEDASVAVILLDLVLGYGSHPDPAGALAEGLAAARARAEARGGHLCVIASVTGTPGDFQGLEAQRRKLESAGALVMPSNYQAALLARRVMERLAARQARASGAPPPATKARPAARKRLAARKRPAAKARPAAGKKPAAKAKPAAGRRPAAKTRPATGGRRGRKR